MTSIGEGSETGNFRPVAAAKEIQKNKLVETYRRNPVRAQRYLDTDKLQNQNPRTEALEMVKA